MTYPRWAGRRVAEAHALVGTWLPAPCGQCGKTVNPGDAYATGHKIPRWERPDLTWVVSNWQPEHRTCSDRSGQREVMRRAYAQGLMQGATGSPYGPSTHTTDGSAPHALISPSGGVFPTQATSGNPPLLPVSPSSATEDQQEVPERLSWATFTENAPEWLSPFLDVPGNSSPPLAITPVHPQAVGSYGPEAIEWIESERGITLRWWQRLAIVRQLEHREDGSLCWRFVVESAPRRAGKSERLRSMALWRMEKGPALFEPEQIVVHIARDLGIAREVQEMAYAWCRERGFKVVTANGKEKVQHTNGARWLLKAKDGVYGFDGHAIIADECWDLSPSAISDGAEPAMRHRVSPQLVMTSTSHPRATSLMPTKISGALAEDDGRTLLLLWAAPWGSDYSDPEVWRAASPYWVEEEDVPTMAAAYREAVTTEPTLDNPDPLGSFAAQHLNVWRLSERRQAKGSAVIEREPWDMLARDVPTDVPEVAAIESWFDQGVSLAVGWRVNGKPLISVTDHADLTEAADELRNLGYRGRVTVGASMKDDPALKGLRVKAGSGSTAAAAADLRNLLREDAIRHDGGDHLTEQVIALRTLPGADGPRVVSKGRACAVKALVWSAQDARQPAQNTKLRIILPSGV